MLVRSDRREARHGLGMLVPTCRRGSEGDTNTDAMVIISQRRRRAAMGAGHSGGVARAPNGRIAIFRARRLHRAHSQDVLLAGRRRSECSYRGRARVDYWRPNRVYNEEYAMQILG